MRYLLAFFLVLGLFNTHLVEGQNSSVKVEGRSMLALSGQPLEFASIVAKDAESGDVIGGAISDIDGNFELTVSKSIGIEFEISYLGLETLKISDFEVANGVIKLGEINLSNNNQNLDEVVVTGQKSTTEFKLDRRVFNVGQDLSSSGASALEVLNNVPSVTVDIEGQISLRGSAGVQILVNGKPSVLMSDEGNALGTLTADMIEKIEVITNPSAKYEAEGSSGIINIVLKKDEKKGLNGSISANVGIPNNNSVGASINRRTEKFNLFSQFGIGYRELPRDNENLNRDLNTGQTLFSNGREYRNENFYNITLGSDYYLTKQDVITLSGSFAFEIEDQPSHTNYRFVDERDSVLRQWRREEDTEADNPKYQYELQYRKQFADNEDQVLQFSALGAFFGKDLSSNFEDRYIVGLFQDAFQETETSFSESQYTFKLDYEQPLFDKSIIEIGAQYVLQDVSNDFEVRDLIGGEWIANPGFTNVFEYDQTVFGTYGTASYEGDVWGIKLGARVEHTELNTLLKNTEEAGSQSYTNLFPSAHFSYKVSDQISLQMGYSRRVYRPRLWDLNPFFNIRDNFTIRAGNPDLLPQFTDSYEVNAIYILDRISLNFGVYHRYTEDVIDRVSSFENNVSIFMPVNIGTNKTTGVEFNSKYSPSNWVEFSVDFNLNYFVREGELEGVSFDFSADRWNSRLRSKWKLPADIEFEATGSYESSFETVQGEWMENAFLDLGLRKKIMKGKLVLNASVRDLFASRVQNTEISQTDFYIESFRQRGRFVTLGLSYGFGKGEAMHYSGRRR